MEMFSFTEKDLDAVALLNPATANNNAVDVQSAIVKAHQVRSEYLHDLIGSTFTGLVARYNDYSAKQKAMVQLGAMSNLELSDLGVTRSNIRHAVMGDTPTQTPLVTYFSKAIVSVVTGLEGWRRRRSGYAQLMAMDARQLSDIGLTRGDIASAMTYGRGLANDNLVAVNGNGGRKVS